MMGLDTIEHYNFYAALLLGLMSSAHCIVMCGGVVSILGANIPMHHNQGFTRVSYLLGYNIGRIFSYALAGALLGFSFGFFALKSHIAFHLLHTISGIMLVLLGCYIGQWFNAISAIEGIGKGLWRFVSPQANKFIPFKTPLASLPFGFVWGWLPCGLVYSTLTWSAASGSALQGALIMLGFGLGTLPTMFAIGYFSSAIKSFIQNKYIRQLSAFIICAYGLNILVKTFANFLF